MKVSVIIPVYNEEKYIAEILKRVLAQPLVDEIIIVNDGSTDATSDRLKTIKSDKISIINKEKNEGKGTAVRDALKLVSGDVALIQDADLEYSPAEYPGLLEPFKDPKVQVVYGSRIRKQLKEYSYLTYLLGGLFLTTITNLLYFSKLTDEPTGYKVFRTGILKNMDLKSKGFEFCPEVTAKVLKQGIEIHEVPVSYAPRKFEEGKKIRPKDGIIAIWTLIKYRFIK